MPPTTRLRAKKGGHSPLLVPMKEVQKKRKSAAKRSVVKKRSAIAHSSQRIENLTDRFLMEKLVGEGMFGQVWRAIDRNDAQNVYALKLLKKVGPEVKREVALLSQFSRRRCHDNVVCYIDEFEANFRKNRYHVIQTTFIDGITMEKWFENWFATHSPATQPPVKTVCKMLVGTLAALKDLHAEGILHLDIKPTNIMIRNRDNEPVIIDFGFSCDRNVIGGDRKTGCALSNTSGTPIYLSADRTYYCLLATACNQDIQMENDVFALALSFYHMLNPGSDDDMIKAAFALGGSDPAKQDRDFSVNYARILDGAVWNPNDVYRGNTAVDALLRSALISDGSKRPSAADLYAKAIKICSSHQ